MTTIIEGSVFTDLDAKGRLLGIEVIAPVKRKTVLDLAPSRLRDELRSYLAERPYSKTVLLPPSTAEAKIGTKVKPPGKPSKKKRQNNPSPHR
jgi:hypothetical protein